MLYLFVRNSANAKTGNIPQVYAHDSTCPPSCPLQEGGCYAKMGHLLVHWRNANLTLDELCSELRSLPRGIMWRYGVAGDLPGRGNRISAPALRALVAANKGKRGYAYTHKPPTEANLRFMHEAVSRGFTINLSANSPREADELRSTGLPVVTLLPRGGRAPTRTPAGHRIVSCPALTRRITCDGCRLCANPTRKVVVGFPLHGPHKLAEATLRRRKDGK
jgi:hypothetical protein